MTYSFGEQQCGNLEFSTRREWILTNGRGGYAMGTVSGINTRRYHGLLVAAIDPPADRMVLLPAVDAFIQGDAQQIGISSNQYPGAVYPEGHHYLKKFTVGKRACWEFKAPNLEVAKVLDIHPNLDAVTLRYENTGSKPLLLTLRPLVSHKPYHENFTAREDYPEEMGFPKDGTIITSRGVHLFLDHPGAQRSPVQGWYYRFEHAKEIERGLDPRDDLFCPCELKYELRPGESAVIVAATKGKLKPHAASETNEDSSLSASLRQAASKYLVTPKSRTTIIAGYPWFTDWGRDTMIALPGICLHTGRTAEARAILDAFASQMFQGLVPNRFVEGGEKPSYNTVDATLWFVHAIYRTLEAEWKKDFAERCFKAIQEIYDWHQKGTLFGIKVDLADGLLTQGDPSTQLTWMDAKVGDWVITPRYGKPVEVNGLWANAMRIGEWLAGKLGKKGDQFAAAAKLAEDNFEAKFWHGGIGHYLDTADPADASLRPNQVIAMSLPFSPADPEHAKAALSVVTAELLTPVGLRTLGPRNQAYKGRYQGPLSELDAAYHQGTVWPWLLGPYCSAAAKLGVDRAEIKAILRNAKEMLSEYGIDGIAEVYDGDQPHSPNGCPWQAWSVAEILRSWIEDAKG